MSNKFCDNVLEFNEYLANVNISLFDNYKLVNPFKGNNSNEVKKMTNAFYKKYYNDFNKRYLILGSSPARRGTSVTGIPFEDASHLFNVTGIKADSFYINKSNSDFLYEVMDAYGGCEKFYKDFYMSFVCPLGISNINAKGNEINFNYYENKKLKESLYDFIVDTLKRQIEFGIDTSVCFCIGSGENYKFLMEINDEYKLFKRIIPLEHPRFIMQYNKKDKNMYLNKYVNILKNKR